MGAHRGLAGQQETQTMARQQDLPAQTGERKGLADWLGELCAQEGAMARPTQEANSTPSNPARFLKLKGRKRLELAQLTQHRQRATTNTQPRLAFPPPATPPTAAVAAAAAIITTNTTSHTYTSSNHNAQHPLHCSCSSTQDSSHCQANCELPGTPHKGRRLPQSQ